MGDLAAFNLSNQVLAVLNVLIKNNPELLRELEGVAEWNELVELSVEG